MATEDKTTLRRFIAEFPWESEDQRKGFLSFLQWTKNVPTRFDLPWALLAAFWAQKDHDATAWIMKTMGEHVSRLEDEIVKLRSEIRAMCGVVE